MFQFKIIILRNYLLIKFTEVIVVWTERKKNHLNTAKHFMYNKELLQIWFRFRLILCRLFTWTTKYTQMTKEATTWPSLLGFLDWVGSYTKSQDYVIYISQTTRSCKAFAHSTINLVNLDNNNINNKLNHSLTYHICIGSLVAAAGVVHLW